MDEIPDGSLVVLDFLGKRERLADQPGNPLAEGVIEALNIAGFACFFADGFVALGGEHKSISLPEIGVDESTLPVNPWQRIPQLLSRRFRTVPHGTPDHFSRFFVLSQPDPDLLQLGAHK